MIVNIYTYVQLKGIRYSRKFGNMACGFVIEAETQRGPETVTETYMISELTCEGKPLITANRNSVELITLWLALSHMVKPADLNIYTDNVYVGSYFKNGKVQKWKRGGWKNARGEPIKNAEYLDKVLEQLLRFGRTVKWHISEHHQYSSWLKNEVENKRDNLRQQYDPFDFRPL